MTTPFPRGFRGGAVAAGIKPSGKPDLILILADKSCAGAAAFTANRFAAPPVLLSAERVRTRATFRGILANAGCANAATGDAGFDVAEATSGHLADCIGATPEEILVASTGVIGVPLDPARVAAGIDLILARIGPTGGADVDPLAEAILTTDTRPKIARRTFPTRTGEEASIVGFAKGAGMIHPRLVPVATMLAFVMTDALIPPGDLRKALARHLPDTLSAISIDGDTSTNDTVFLLASGEAGEVEPAATPGGEAPWEESLAEVLEELAEGLVADGEGVRHVAEIRVVQAETEEEARRAAETIATSLLVKTALAGCDPNWGRILAALGRSGVDVDPEKVALWIGGALLFEKGLPTGTGRVEAEAALRAPRVVIEISLGRGNAEGRCLTGDLTAEYVRINAEYTT